MAKSTTKGPKVRTFPKPDEAANESSATATAVEDPPPSPETPFDDPPAAEPKPLAKEKKIPKVMTFFQRLQTITMADWGTRAKIRLYRLAPLIDRLRGSETKFIQVYEEPINEQRIKIDHGSGRYRLYLNYKGPAEKGEKELDCVEIDILDHSYPPKVPGKEWMDDPRNNKWAWAKPPEVNPQPPATGLDTLVEAMRVTNDIRREVKEEMVPGTPATPPAPTAVDPWSAAEKILNMRSENPMVAILQQQMADNAKAAEAERERAFKAAEAAREREFKLQQQLLESKSGPGKGIVDQLLELVPMLDKLEPVKKFFGFGNGTGEVVGRAARTTAYDVIKDIAQSPFGANLGQGLGILLSTLATPAAAHTNGAAPAAMPQQPPVVVHNPNLQTGPGAPPPGENPEQRIQRIGQTITGPMLYEFFLKDELGSLWAERMFDMWPDDYMFMRSLGPDNILMRYRQYTPAWAVIQAKEGSFIEFIREFCAWNPNDDDGPAPPNNDDDGVTDLEMEQNWKFLKN